MKFTFPIFVLAALLPTQSMSLPEPRRVTLEIDIPTTDEKVTEQYPVGQYQATDLFKQDNDDGKQPNCVAQATAPFC